jgi:hypothetical protein
MPDQSSASTEHALMQDITAPLATLPDDPVPIAADVDFPVVLRGYDRIAVDAYVKKTSQLVAELQATRSPEAAVRRALERVGEEVAGILQRAHDTAGQITSQSRSEAEDRLEVARHEAALVTAQAEDRLKELDVETDRIWEERLRIVEDARELARQLLILADSAAERFPPAEDTAGEGSSGPAVAQALDDGASTDTALEPEGEPAAVEPDAEGAPERIQPGPDTERDWGDDLAEDQATAVMPPLPPPDSREDAH